MVLINIILWFLTVLAYHTCATAFHLLLTGRPHAERTRGWHLRLACLLAVLCMPFNYNGDIYTVLGNAKSEKSIYSVASVYQCAELDTVNMISLGTYQNAGRNAVSIFGIVSGQIGGRASITISGLVGYQQSSGINLEVVSDPKTVVRPGVGIGIGLAVYQGGLIIDNVICLACYQDAVEKLKVTALNLALYQKIGDSEKAFALSVATGPDVSLNKK